MVSAKLFVVSFYTIERKHHRGVVQGSAGGSLCRLGRAVSSGVQNAVATGACLGRERGRRTQAAAGALSASGAAQQAPLAWASPSTPWEVNRDGRVPVLGKSRPSDPAAPPLQPRERYQETQFWLRQGGHEQGQLSGGHSLLQAPCRPQPPQADPEQVSRGPEFAPGGGPPSSLCLCTWGKTLASIPVAACSVWERTQSWPGAGEPRTTVKVGCGLQRPVRSL